MKHPFKIGETYRNRRGEYTVLALAGDKMDIRYEDGAEDSVSIGVQARIWENMAADEADPLGLSASRQSRAADAEGRDGWPIGELVQSVLKGFSAPYPENIIDEVCLAIEKNPGWMRRYEALVAEYSKGGRDGKATVNTGIGRYTKEMTQMVTVMAGNEAKSGLLKTYSTLRHER